MVKTTAPKIDTRPDQHYVGIRTEIGQGEMGSGIIPQLIDETATWLAEQGITPTGGPFMRFHVINMEEKMQIEIGWPVATALSGNGRVQAGVLPAGRYASLIYTGVENGIAGNSVLIGWGEQQGLKWDRWDDPKGDAFRSRYEIFLTGPEDDPDPANWDTEVAIKLAD